MAKHSDYNRTATLEKPARVEELDIEALLAEKKTDLHYKDGEIFEGTPTKAPDLLTSTQVEEITRDYERSHSKVVEMRSIQEEKRRTARLSRRRALQTIVFVGAIILAGVLISLLLYPQSELSELSRDNSDAKDRIAAIKQEIVDAEEGVNGITDMESIRAQALTLGMQDPNANQVVFLAMPGNDQLVTVESYDAYGISEEALSNSMTNLAGYYRNN